MSDRDVAGDAGGRMQAVHDATLVFEYERERRARIVAESVRPEVGEIDDERSRTALRREGSAVEISIEARDLTALRAAANTWFTLVSVAERVNERGRRTTIE